MAQWAPARTVPAGSLGRPGLSRAASLGLPHPALALGSGFPEESPVVGGQMWDGGQGEREEDEAGKAS